jgi:hypothetical protein
VSLLQDYASTCKEWGGVDSLGIWWISSDIAKRMREGLHTREKRNDLARAMIKREPLKEDGDIRKRIVTPYYMLQILGRLAPDIG